MAVIEIQGLHKRFGANHVLRGIDLEAQQGEVLCLLGPNGAGKTTTLEILEGFGQATSGRVRVLGFDPAGQAPSMRVRTGIVLQECGFPRRIRVRELLDNWRAYYPAPRPLGELLDLVELDREADVFLEKLSGGQRRRLDFALALVGDPDLVFLDEPTTGFDPEARRRCWTAIDNLRALGKTILLTTHYLDEAERLSDRVALLAEGVISHVGAPDELARRSGTPSRLSYRAPSVGDPAPAGWDVTVARGQVVTAVLDAQKAMHELLQWAETHGLELIDLTLTPPTLEDAYLQVIGGSA